ncbi:MAG: tetratricopeptide repeat protein [Parasphingorhabdus sp.]
MISAKILGPAAAFILMSATTATAQTSGEIGYAQGALGYDALVAGNNELALRQLEASEKDHAEDPARLINLGQTYARLGRPDVAARMFTAAIESNRNFDLVLANGQVINSRDAAELALRDLGQRMAAR